MDPVTIGLGVAGASALLSEILAGKSREEAEAILAGVRDEFGRLDPAKVERLVAQEVNPDAQYDSAMRGSLSALDSEIDAKGLGIADQASLNDALDRVGRQDRAQRQHILADQEARGAGGSAQSLLAQLVNQQGSAERAQGAGLDAAGDAQRRYWQAIRDRFGMAAQGADQRSAIDRWNATQRTEATRSNNALAQQAWDNKFRQTSAKAELAEAQAGRKDAEADRINSAGAAIGQAGANAAMQYGYDQERKKRKDYGY